MVFRFFKNNILAPNCYKKQSKFHWTKVLFCIKCSRLRNAFSMCVSVVFTLLMFFFPFFLLPCFAYFASNAIHIYKWYFVSSIEDGCAFKRFTVFGISFSFLMHISKSKWVVCVYCAVNAFSICVPNDFSWIYDKFIHVKLISTEILYTTVSSARLSPPRKIVGYLSFHIRHIYPWPQNMAKWNKNTNRISSIDA